MNIKKRILLALAVFTLNNVWAADKKSDAYNSLIQTGTEEEIIRALNKDKKFSKTLLGDEKDSLVMKAIEYNRDESIIKILIKNEYKPAYQNKNRQTALTYAAKFSTERNLIKFICVKSGNTKDVKKLLAAKDKFGKSPYDYAEENTEAKIVFEPYMNSSSSSSRKKKTSENETIVIEKDAEPEQEAPAEPEVQAETPEASGIQPEQQSEPELPAEPEVQPETEPEPEPEITEAPEEVVESSPTVNKYDKIYLYDFVIPDEDPEPEVTTDKEELAFIENPDRTDRNGRTLLMLAAKDGNDWEIRSLLQSNANVNLKDKDGWTALMYATRYQNNVDLINLLIEAGAKCSIKNKFGATAVHIAAAYNNNPDIIKKLITEANLTTDELFKAFILAVTANSGNDLNQVTKLKVFIDRGIAINRFYEGRTPLMYAAEYSTTTDVIKLLLDNGAVPGARTADGKTAFTFAEANSHLEHNDVYWSLNGR